MKPVRQSINSTGAQAAVPLDYNLSPFNVSFRVNIQAATVNYKVQYTLDDVFDSTITPEWVDDVNVGAGTVAGATGNYMFPVRAVRVNVSSLSGGPIVFTVIEGSP